MLIRAGGKGAFVARGVEELSRGTFSADKEEAKLSEVSGKRRNRQVRGEVCV